MVMYFCVVVAKGVFGYILVTPKEYLQTQRPHIWKYR